jgi:protein-S-isoprenylcysteine O-methyltransferase Ste14
MNGFLLVLPILIIRYGVTALLGREALRRTAFFPPTRGMEKAAYWVYQLSFLANLLLLIFTRAALATIPAYAGLGLYVAGMFLYLLSILHFGKPDTEGLNTRGLYRVSRNPMYVAFFLYFLGIALLTGSWVVFLVLVVFQISVHFLILSEERWCIEQFGTAYTDYMRRVNRYL